MNGFLLFLANLLVCLYVFERQQGNSTNSERMELQPFENSGLKKAVRSDPISIPYSPHTRTCCPVKDIPVDLTIIKLAQS